MVLVYIVKLGFSPQKTSIVAQKIDSSPLETYYITSTKFLVQNSVAKIQFINKTFLLANISFEVVLKMLLISISNTDIKFAEIPEKLT